MPKLTKSETNYREAMGSQHCGNCSMYRPYVRRGEIGTCTLVQGEIHAFDVCDRWEPLER
jgi:hypothetical protein